MAVATKRHYVYTLAEPGGTIFYVGKGVGYRIAQHDAEARTACDCPKCDRIRSIWAAGGKVVRSVVFESDNQVDALNEEQRLISEIGREELCNRSDGGEGRVRIPDGYITYREFLRQEKAWMREQLRRAPAKEYKQRRAELEAIVLRRYRRFVEYAEWIEERVQENAETLREAGVKFKMSDLYETYSLIPKKSNKR